MEILCTYLLFIFLKPTLHYLLNSIYVTGLTVQGQTNGPLSPYPTSPRLNQSSVTIRPNKRNFLKKQASYAEQCYKSTPPKLVHSASLEKFPGNRSWIKPSLSLGNIPSYKQRLHGSIAFSSSESLIEEPEPNEPHSEMSPHLDYDGKIFYTVHFKVTYLIALKSRVILPVILLFYTHVF